MSDAYITSFEKIKHSDFYNLQQEYLPDSETDRLKKHCDNYSRAYIELIKEKKLIGLAFGWPRKIYYPDDETFVLDGIAVKVEYQKNGYGKQMLKEFFVLQNPTGIALFQ